MSNDPNKNVHNRRDIVNVLNDLFSTVSQFWNNISSPSDKNAYKAYLQSINSDNLYFTFSTVTCEQTNLLISNWNKTGPLYDDFPMFVCKENTTSLSQIIEHICNRTLTSRIFRSEVTIGWVTCLFKAGNCKHPGTYALITILVKLQ